MGFHDVIRQREKHFQNKGTTFRHSEEIYYRTGKVKDKNRESGFRDSLFLRISQPILEKLGLRAGDRVTLLQDDEEPLKIAIMGSLSGPKLTPSNYTSQFDSYEDAIGEFCPCNFQLTIYDEDNLPRTGGHSLKIIQWEVDEIGNTPALIITLPRDSVEMETKFDQMRQQVAENTEDNG